MTNTEIRTLVFNSGVTYRQIAKQMNVRPDYLSRVLRNEITPAMKERIMTAVSELQKGEIRA